MTAMVRVMEESGLVERRGDASDKRVTLVCLTEDGASHVRTRRQAGVHAFERLIGELTSEEVEAKAFLVARSEARLLVLALVFIAPVVGAVAGLGTPRVRDQPLRARNTILSGPWAARCDRGP
ncbi:MarR family winged helix-turn-helix transcriptional regulator [Streptomyces sp. NPDC002499]